MDLLKQTPAEMRPLSPIELDGEELRGVEVRREWRNIDLLIKCEQPAFVIAIENKVDSGESEGQLQRYEDAVRQEWPSLRRLHVFLTADGGEASDEDWVPYSYAAIHRVLARLQQSNRGAIGGDVAAFLDHYLRLIGSRFMNDPTIDELCQRIYTNHRQAIDLIWDRVGSTSSGLVASLASLVQQQPGRWTVLSTTSKRVVFAPTAWRDLFPAVGERKTFDPRLWVVCRLEVGQANCRFAVQAWPATDAELRRRTIERLVQNPKEFGFKLFFKAGAGQKWTALCREEIARWPEDDDPELDSIIAKAQAKLEQAWNRLAGVPNALRPLFDEWNRSQTAGAQR